MDSPINRLIDRARAAMNLILALTLVLGWASFDRKPGVMDHVETVYRLLYASAPEDLSTLMLSFVVRVESGVTSGLTIEQSISDIPVIDILLLGEINEVSRAFPPTLEILSSPLESQILSEVGGASPFAQKLAERLTEAGVADAVSVDDAYNALDAYADSQSTLTVQQFARALSELEVFLKAAELPPSAAVATLNDASQRLIKIPFVEQEVRNQTASVIITIALLGPYLYLASICLALRKSAEVTVGSEGADWSFFHFGKIGPILGALWLLLPAGVVLGSNLYFGDTDKTGVFLFGVIGVVGANVVRLALDARLAYSSRWEK